MTNVNQDITETVNAKSAKQGHMLTLLLDLSHPSFANGDLQAKINLIEVFKGCARGLLAGAEAMVIGGKADGSDPLGAMVIMEDDEVKASLAKLVAQITAASKEDNVDVISIEL